MKPELVPTIRALKRILPCTAFAARQSNVVAQLRNFYCTGPNEHADSHPFVLQLQRPVTPGRRRGAAWTHHFASRKYYLGQHREAAQDSVFGSPQTPLGLTRFRVTFPNAGVFPYKCTLHDTLGMTGMVIVYPNVPP